MPNQSRSVRREQGGRDEALETYILEHAPGLREHYEAQSPYVATQAALEAFYRYQPCGSPWNGSLMPSSPSASWTMPSAASSWLTRS